MARTQIPCGVVVFGDPHTNRSVSFAKAGVGRMSPESRSRTAPPLPPSLARATRGTFPGASSWGLPEPGAGSARPLPPSSALERGQTLGQSHGGQGLGGSFAGRCLAGRLRFGPSRVAGRVSLPSQCVGCVWGGGGVCASLTAMRGPYILIQREAESCTAPSGGCAPFLALARSTVPSLTPSSCPVRFSPPRSPAGSA